jgi:hypothetical protein
MGSAITWAIVRGWLGKNWLPILIVFLIVGGGIYLDRRGYNRAKEQDEKRRLERQELTRAVVAAIDVELDHRLATIAAATAGKIQTIDTEGKTVVQPIITREILRDRNLADPSRCLSPGLLEAVNAARGYLDDRLAGGSDARSANPASVPGSGSRH